MSEYRTFIHLTLYVYPFILPIGQKKDHSKWTNNPYIYSFSLAVYCTWTYYGSIGLAANSGLSYLPIYVGPIIIIPTWMIILKRIIQFRVNKISSIADFISLRYGNSRFLGALVTLFAFSESFLFATIKIDIDTFHIVTKQRRIQTYSTILPRLSRFGIVRFLLRDALCRCLRKKRNCNSSGDRVHLKLVFFYWDLCNLFCL
jgi:hypothetical protein